ncbi:uncharacterized protein N7483_005019 [Penicillium malachiteum]|uniref:uncharacterized protein n=1 Tax=Penicillium malachiteum TaxID=1324776 RepID=UPI002549512A|nr:uncharacterized protein N7483_005019 [Penicillium malachiteum]KAJ5730511.1 hypothetical protein N7483_005019 [Penicillium malachiteum]
MDRSVTRIFKSSPNLSRLTTVMNSISRPSASNASNAAWLEDIIVEIFSTDGSMLCLNRTS